MVCIDWIAEQVIANMQKWLISMTIVTVMLSIKNRLSVKCSSRTQTAPKASMRTPLVGTRLYSSKLKRRRKNAMPGISR